ncbi:MAG: IclR family transcriptional regulator [Desulfobacterales bacterium]|nr:IclR family transcriptional regulator [Desulfobacterales bacterium]
MSNAIEKALLVLSNFADGNTPIGTVELAERLNFNKTTASRILNTLKRHNFLEQNPYTKQYSLGPAVAQLGKAITQSLSGQTTIIAQPYCDRLRDEIGETVHFQVLSGNHFYLAYEARGSNPVSVAIDVGDTVYPTIHSGAKAIAAFSDPVQIDKWLNGQLPVFTSRSVTDPRKIRAMYNKFTELGYAIDDREYSENIYAISAPVFNNNGTPVAAVVVVVPYSRKKNCEREEVIQAMKETAGLISSRLLYPGSSPDSVEGSKKIKPVPPQDQQKSAERPY